MEAQNIGLKMSELTKALGNKLIVRFMEEAEFSMENYFILNILYERDNVIQHDLAEVLKKDKSAVLRQIDFLEMKKLVVRISDTEDRRKKTITLTKNGVNVIQKLRKIEVDVINGLLEGIPKNDLDIFFSVLERMKSKVV